MTLSVKALSVTLGGRCALREASFEAYRGEFLVVVGPNGAGKTTLLKAIAGLVNHAGGLDWDEKSISMMRLRERAKLLAYLPQGHVCAWPLKARDVVSIGRAPFASSLARLSREDDEAVESALRSVDASEFADRPITELSGGERARIMLARALAADTPVLLADEPVAALDPAHQLAVMSILSAQARTGRLVIGVSHDLLLAARYADRVLVVAENGIAGLGTPAATLTPDLLRQVFEIESLRLSADGKEIEIPWSPAPGSRMRA